MRKLIILIAIICAWGNTHAQINIVHNPSFESHWRCPQYIDLVKYANYWTAIVDTNVSVFDTLAYFGCLPEYCNACSGYFKVNVPSNWTYRQYPRTGDGMMQAAMNYNYPDSTYDAQRDYVQGRFRKNLVAGQDYCVSFYVVSEESSPNAISKIGAYLDDGTIDTVGGNCGFPQSMYSPQVYTTTIINDTVNWTKIQGTFTATGNEHFITIGNFFDGAHTDSITVGHSLLPGNFMTRYLVDDVSLIKVGTVANAGNDTTIYTGDTAWLGEHLSYARDSVWHIDSDDYTPCKWYTTTGVLVDSNHSGPHVYPAVTTSYVMELDVCGVITRDTVTVHVHDLGIAGTGSMGSIKIYPNPAANEVHISGAAAGATYRLLNAVGVVVQSGILQQKDNRLNLTSLAGGTYVLEVVGEDGSRGNFRIVKQ